MNEWTEQVLEFHKALAIPIGTTPKLSRVDLRSDLIEEECYETITAAGRGDIVEAADGLCDIIVATVGSAIEWGIDLDPLMREVHRTNVAKKDGPVREDGKRLKPEGWLPPDIRAKLLEQNWEG